MSAFIHSFIQCPTAGHTDRDHFLSCALCSSMYIPKLSGFQSFSSRSHTNTDTDTVLKLTQQTCIQIRQSNDSYK